MRSYDNLLTLKTRHIPTVQIQTAILQMKSLIGSRKITQLEDKNR